MEYCDRGSLQVNAADDACLPAIWVPEGLDAKKVVDTLQRVRHR